MKARLFGGLGLFILAVIGFLIYLSLFVVQQTEQALVLRFGEPVRVILSPGLYAKLPLVDNVEVLEKRILDLDSPPLEIIASDQKRLVVDAFGRYRIVDPLRFFQSVGTIPVADQRLSVLLNSAVRQVLGEATFESVVRDQRAELMARINERVNRESQSLGIEVVDVRIRRADLPEANSQAIYQRMQTERQREATEIRAQIRGDGDAARAAIFAEAYGANPEFFDFFRSMVAYQNGLKPNTTRMLISPDSEFFRYFNDATGAAPLTPRPPTPSGRGEQQPIPDSSAREAMPGTSDVQTTGSESEAGATTASGETSAPIVTPGAAGSGTMSSDVQAEPAPTDSESGAAPAPAQ
jgi:membrane protease subunit HflC